ncbi:hypothetical protein [Halorussus salinus]|uniref:hypothetical protein n=1 Tax=Halorussus salinus TaxID=1364935 RepID=UPI001092670E|nr:hypothetical protein [Halorussus salinus]
MSDENEKFDRRSVLRGMGTAAMSVSFFGTATAASARDADADETDPFHDFAADVSTDVDDPTRTELVGRYADAESLKAAFRDDADPILQTLADEGVLESATLSAFEFGEVREEDLLVPTDAASGAGVTAIEHADRGVSAHLMATTASEDHRVALYRQPELDNTYAKVETDDGGFYVHDVGDGVTISADCGWERVYCSSSICQTGDPPSCTEQQRYCCYGPNYETKDCTDTRYVCSCTCDDI